MESTFKLPPPSDGSDSLYAMYKASIKPTDHKVVQNSDTMHADLNIKWLEDVEYTPPDEREIKMLSGTMTALQLIDLETNKCINVDNNEEIVLLSKSQLQKTVSTKCKIIALKAMKEKPLTNTSNFSREKKQELISHMNDIVAIYYKDESKFNDMFNTVCNQDIFTNDYTTFPIYR